MIQVDVTLGVDRKVLDLMAFLFERFGRIKDGLVLRRARHEAPYRRRGESADQKR